MTSTPLPLLGPDETPKAAICHPDQMGRTALEHVIVANGFDVMVEAEHAPGLLQALQFASVHLVVVENALSGTLGMDIIGDLVKRESQTQVVLVTNDISLRDEALGKGAWAIAPRGDAAAMERILGEILHYLRTGERRGGGDRRSGAERRETQDWSKVTSERRSGSDRRRAERRDD
ncbi:MAG: DUF188 domain-containing protein [Acidimicrobiia bacterium]|nr:DUF188 domain-containing protein [Acidimicrobiia bacterium]